MIVADVDDAQRVPRSPAPPGAGIVTPSSAYLLAVTEQPAIGST